MSVLVGLTLVLPPWQSQPAHAAAPGVRIDLAQSSPDSAIGSDLTLTATVTWTGGESPVPPNGWYVEFTGTGGDAPWSSGPVVTAGGVATYTRTSPVTMSETITARLATPGCTPESATVTHEWWEPEITVLEENENSTVGTRFELTGFVTRGADPVPDAAVRVVVDNRTADVADQDLEAATDEAGTFTVSWTGATPSIERVTASATAAGGFTATTVTAHTWSGSDPVVASLAIRAADERRVADRLTATASYDLLGEASDPDIRFWTDQSWLGPTSSDSETSTADFDYAGRSAAGWGIMGVRSSETGLHRAQAAYWWQPTITFLAPDSQSASGQAYQATVLVTDRGNPVEGMYLDFSTPGDEFPFDHDTTNSDGIASVPVTAPPGAPLTIVATEGHDETSPPLPPLHTPAERSTTHRWVSVPGVPTVDLRFVSSSEDDELADSRVGTRVPFTARITSGSNPLQGWDVAFDVDGEAAGTATTNASGDAVLPISRTTESYAEITATVVIAGCGTRSAETDHYWWETQLDLTPKAAAAPARRAVTFTAEVARTIPDSDGRGFAGDGGTRDGVGGAAIPAGMIALPDQLIRFTMSSQSCTLPVAISEDETNDDGIATVTMSRDGPSIDSVRAEEVGVFDPAVDTTSHAWSRPDPVPRSVSLTQSSQESRAGTDVTIEATVHDTAGPDGRAPAGVPVTFLGVSPTRTVTTDGDGIARTTIRGTGTSPTTVTATAPFGCGVVPSLPLVHHWYVPTLELLPPTATWTTGETATVTARLTHDGAPVIGQAVELTIDHSTTGVATETPTRSTGIDGTAVFPWSRTQSGTDDLTAIEVIDVLPQQASATHRWQAPPVTPPVTPAPETPPPVTPPPTTPPPVITEPPVTNEPSPEPSASENPTKPPPPPKTPESPTDLPATSTLVDGPEVGRPGADIELSGRGCNAGQHLTVRLGDTELGRTRAAADGTFYLRAVVPDLRLGRYVLHSTCGTTIGDPNVDITSPQVDKARAGIAAVGVTTAATFAFFVLVIKGIISFLPRQPM